MKLPVQEFLPVADSLGTVKVKKKILFVSCNGLKKIG